MRQTRFRVRAVVTLVVAVLFVLGTPAFARTLVASGSYGAVATGHPLATAAAIRLLQNGGNAVDAAVAAGFVLGVVDPSSSGIGGDGHALVCMQGTTEAWDGSSIPPAARTASATVIGLPTIGHLLLEMHREHGRVNLAQVMAPAIRHAAGGFRVTGSVIEHLRGRLPKFPQGSVAVGFLKDGRPISTGELLVQPALADTLMRIARDGGHSFLRGRFGQEIVEELDTLGTGYSFPDWQNAAPRRSAPIRVRMRGFDILGVPPPSSSVVVMAILERLQRVSPACWSDVAFAETLQMFLNDEDLQVAAMPRRPVRFLEKARLATPGGWSTLPISDADQPGGQGDQRGETTHLVTWDRFGNVVSLTLTLGTHFGAGRISRFGFFFNSQMEHFRRHRRIFPEYPSSIGPVTAKSPILVLRLGEPVLALGGAGANRIIANVTRITGKYLWAHADLARLVHEPRLYVDHRDVLVREWFPGVLATPFASGKKWREMISPAGSDYFGLISAVEKNGTVLTAVGDYRRDGCAGALSRNPDADQTFCVEAVLTGADMLSESRPARPANNVDEQAGPWRTSTRALRTTVRDGSTIRDRFRFFPKTSAVQLKQTVKLRPVSVDKHSAPAWKKEPFPEPEPEPEPELLTTKESEFLQSVPVNLKPNDLVQWLMVEIGHRNPCRPIPGSSAGNRLLIDESGDRNDNARLLKALLASRGVPCRLVGGVILREGISDKTHVWNEVFIDGRWIPVCTIHQIFGRIPGNWLILKYGDQPTNEGDGNVFFRIRRKGD